MNKAHNRCLFTRLLGKYAPVKPAGGWIVGKSPGSRANNIYSPGSGKLTEKQLHVNFMLIRQPGNPNLSLTLKNLFLLSDLAVKAAKSENKKGFSTSDKARTSI